MPRHASIDAHPYRYQAGSVNLNQLVNTKLMPYFDVTFAARFVLGRWWRNATAEQRTQFTDAFSRLLLHNCANDLVQFSDLSFSMRKTASGWMADDVAVDGISYDKGFRDDFQEKIEQKGLDELTAR